MTRRSSPLTKELTLNTSRMLLHTSRLGVVSAALSVTVLAGAGTALAHAEVTASDARALAENVTLSFTSEAESDTAGIASLRIVLPEGITPGAVVLKDGPKGWALTPSADGYTVSGPALKAGTDAEHSIVVRQLPNAKSLAFKTIETYSDGKVSRWIEVPGDAEQSEQPAPVLKLKAAAPGAKAVIQSPTASPTPSKAATTPAPENSKQESAPSADAASEERSDSSSSGGIIALVVAVLLVLGGGTWWVKKR
ncbi:DUF1775 domain-containing protein [Streptomyces cinereoruber]|uniref:DUF1775 domain-containing protein n=1 Tax=Streptomyces cinereoruber TaxID=67260 RepID=UPI003C2D72C4